MKLLGSAFRMAAMDSPKLDAAPLFVREGMVRPYMDGWAFVKNLHAMGGQAAVDKAFRRPPASSEQVLHPEKYLANEAPLKVAVLNLLPVLGKGWKVLHENTLGEFGVNILLRTAKLGSSVIGPAARGWGGDRFRAYRHEDGRVTLYWRTMWDSGRDAREFFDAYAGLLKRRFSSAAVTSKSDAGGQSALTLQVQQGERRIWCTLRGSEVSILDGDLDAPPHLPGAKPVQ